MSGFGTLTLLFMPGIDGTGISFEPLRPFLPENILSTVITYPTDRTLDFHETVEHVARQIRFTPDFILAESFSGPVAVALLASGFMRTKGLILTATFARAPRPGLMRILPVLPVGHILRLPLPDAVLARILGGGKAAEVILPLWHQVKAKVPASILAHRVRIVGRIDVRNQLSELAMPCLYIQATRDRIVPPSSVLDFAASMRELRVERIEGPHPILQVEPEASAAVIVDFMKAVMAAVKPDAAPG